MDSCLRSYKELSHHQQRLTFTPYVPIKPWNLTRSPCHHIHELLLTYVLTAIVHRHPIWNQKPPLPLTHQADSAFPSMWLPGWTVPGICPPVGVCRYRGVVVGRGSPRPSSDWRSAASPCPPEDPETGQKKKSQSQQMSHSELMPSETHKYAEAISTQLRCLWRHRLCCLYGCSLLGFWQTNIGWLMWNAVCQRGTFATDPRSRNSGTLYNTERFIWSWISIVWPRLANSTRQSFRCKHLQ